MIDKVSFVKLVGRVLDVDVEVKEAPPSVVHLSRNSKDVKADLLSQGLNLLYSTLLDGGDEQYHYTTLTGWRIVAPYIYRTYTFPKYVPGRKDCDFFALLFVAMAQSKFGFNGCGIVYGIGPNGYHAFVQVATETGWWLWEPDPAYKISEFFRPGERGYYPRHILI